MGWKNVKEAYRIEHTVCVTEEGICIGSPYIHNIIVVGTDGRMKKRYDDPARVVEILNNYCGKVYVDDPLCVGFVKGDVKKIVIEKHTGINELEFKTAKAIAVKKNRGIQCILTTIVLVPFSTVIATVFSGLVFLFYSSANNASGLEYSHVFWSLFKCSMPLIYTAIFCLEINSDLKNEEVPDADVLLEYDKIKSK